MNNINWLRIAVIAACLISVVFLVPNIMILFNHNAKDPNWDKTHVQTNSLTEAIQFFGNGLLLDKIALTNDYTNHSYEFCLEHSVGGKSNRKEWKYLTAWMNYGENFSYFGDDCIHLYIYFDKSSKPLEESEDLLSESSKTNINGTVVEYKDWSGDDRWFDEYNYIYCAKFDYNDYTYFIEAYSHENKNLFWDTITQMLNS